METTHWLSKSRSSSSLTWAVAFGIATFGSTASFAYRPFDGTDAAVADPKEVEIEFEPAGVLRQNAQTSLIAPFMIFNYGFEKNWELVLQGQGQSPLTIS